MLHFDRGTWSRAGYAIVLAVVFLVVNAQVAHAASGSGGDMLSPLNIDTSEGVPIDGYELSSQPGSLFSFDSNAYSFVMSGLFTLIRLLVGLACWAIEFAFRFPLLNLLSDPAQKVSDAYNKAVVDTLGLKALMLAWAFVFGLILFVRGKAAKGLGEIALTLLIAAFAASAFVRPDYLLAENGPLAQTERAASEVARDAVNSHDWGGKISSGDPGPCSGMSGPAEQKCWKIEDDKPLKSTDVARPLQDSLTNALVVKGYMLLQYGRTLDPGKPADRKAYALHLRWVSGGYKPGGANDTETNKEAEEACSSIKGPAKKHCEEGMGKKENGDDSTPIGADGLPALTAGDALLEATSPIVSEEDQQFEAFLNDLKKKGGPVGKASAKYAEKSTGWRAAGALMLFVAALLICAIPLSSAIVMLGTQAADAGAAAVGGITLVWAMLPGPNRQAAWKWLAVLAVSVAGLFAICMFLPFYGIAIDVILTDGPDLPAERLLALDFLAFAGVAFHRYLMRAISSFGQRMSMRMRYAKIGGTHLPGDSSEIGAALAMSSAGSGGYGLGGGLRGLAGGGAYGRLGTRQRIMQSLAAMTDGAGMPIDTGQVLADVGAEMSRGLAPVAIAATGARLGVRAGWGLLVGKRPDDKNLERLRKPTGSEGDHADSEGEGTSGARMRREGTADRYRDTDGKVTDRWSGEVLHDQGADRTLLTTRAHNRLVRLRGYRILNRTSRIAYGASYGLPSNVRRAGVKRSQYSQDTRQQLQVWGNTVREDGREWGNGYRHTARVLRENTDDRGADAPFTSRTLRTTSTPTARPAGRPPSEGPTRPTGSGDSWSRLVFGDGPAGADSRGGGTGSSTSTPAPERPRPRPAPRRRDPAEERRRFIERMGAGDTPETRRRVQEEMRRRYGDTNGTGGDGGESG